MSGHVDPIAPPPSAAGALLAGVIDYAGLFPPAGLGMEEALRDYVAGRRSPEGWMLARFAVPARRLPELGRAAAGLPGPESGSPWGVSAIGGEDPPGDLAAIAAFNGVRPDLFLVDTFETRPAAPAAIGPLTTDVPAALTIYIEAPGGADAAEWIAGIARAGARAKLRAGGVTPDRIPAARTVAAFLAACAAAGVPFKATAGLHHALRSVHPLTYEPGSATALMHGLLNVMLAAALAPADPGGTELEELLEERSSDAFRFGPDAVSWRGRTFARADLEEMRLRRLVAIGSCSFDEPVAELRRMGVL